MDGNNKLIKQLLADGITYMFGNPGTVEEGFLDAMYSYDDFNYITCLHESVAVAMADGYSRKSKKASVVQLHSGVGLGNGIGMIYQAMRGHSPLVIIAGEAGIKYDAMDAQMACNLVDMAKPVTKWASRVTHKDSLLRMVRRAIKTALTPPMGPVFLSLPLDILDEENFEDVVPTVTIQTESAPDICTVNKVTDMLLPAKNPIFIIGDGISCADARCEIEELAELIGAKVYGADYSEVNFNSNSPHFMGQLGHMFGDNSKKVVENADAIVIVGTYVFPEVFPCLTNVFIKDAKIIHIDLNTYEIAKNFNVNIGIAAHPKPTLKLICDDIKSRISCEQKSDALERCNILSELKKNSNQNIDDGTVVSEFMKQLKQSINSDIIIFDEALTSSKYLNYYFSPIKDGSFFQTRGGSLGVGIPGAMGIKLADPEKTVFAFVGDGGSMYTIQALHTAARYGIDIKIIIMNNGKYQLLRDNIDKYWTERQIESHSYPDCFNLDPAIDFVSLAKSLGIADGIKIECIDDVGTGIDKLLSSDTAFIVDLKTN